MNHYLWTIYADPDDFPGQHVARLFVIIRGEMFNTSVVFTGETLDSVRQALQEDVNCNIRVDRAETDIPAIVESWTYE
jgi:hypothetical protein